MNIQNIEKKEKNMATFEVKVPADVFDNAVNEVYKKNKNHLYVAGFRKGKAPRAVIEGMYGKEVFYPDAIEALAQDAFEAGRADCGFECVGAPSLIDQKVTEDKELIYTFEVGMYPEVQLGQYKGLEVPQNHEAFDESKVDEEMHNVQKRNARLLDVEREAKMGDHVTIDFAGFIDGEQFDGGTAEDYDLELGSNTFVPGFEEQIVGMKAGDERDVVVTFPENYVEALAGKEATFKVTVKSVKEPELPALDDELAKDISDYETIAEYRDHVREDLEKEFTEQQESDYATRLMKAAVDNMTVEIPEPMILSSCATTSPPWASAPNSPVSRCSPPWAWTRRPSRRSCVRRPCLSCRPICCSTRSSRPRTSSSTRANSTRPTTRWLKSTRWKSTRSSSTSTRRSSFWI